VPTLLLGLIAAATFKIHPSGRDDPDAAAAHEPV
jgi:hypothetical protein